MVKAYKINSVEMRVLNSTPKTLAVFAVASVTSSGWCCPRLVPWVYVAPPVDGVYDFDLVATPPSGIALDVITPIAIADTFAAPPSGFKGVRIHASANAVEALIAGTNAVDFSDAGSKPLWDGDLPWPDILRASDGNIVGNG